jgi:glycosyltransferase involved in cell wall biosynthesis
MPKITIIIPVYNTEKYLHECLDSVVNQTLRDIEIVCIDDGSTDYSPEILDEYAKKDSRLIVIHQQNAGQNLARNVGIKLVSSKYIQFIDSDDFIDTTLCEKTFNIAEQEHADMTFFLFEQSPKTFFIHLFEKNIKYNNTNYLYKNILVYNAFPWNRLWKTSFIQDHQLTFPRAKICAHEDNVFNFQSMIFEPNITILPERLYWYRYNSTSNSHSYNLQMIDAMETCYEAIRKNLKESYRYNNIWKQAYLERKLNAFLGLYFNSPVTLQPYILKIILRNYGNDESSFINENTDIPLYIRDFYHALEGSTIAIMRNVVWNMLRRTKQTVRKQFDNIYNKLQKNK